MTYSGAREAAARELVREDIARIVDEARTSGETLRAGYHAAQIALSRPEATFIVAIILKEIVRAAEAAGVRVEDGRLPNTRRPLNHG